MLGQVIIAKTLNEKDKQSKKYLNNSLIMPINKPYAMINGVRTLKFDGFDDIIQCALQTQAILVALNSDKLYYSDPRLKQIINNNIGYCDGVGAVWALSKKGVKGAVKIAGCELWLEIIKRYPTKKYYLIGAEETVIVEVVKRLKLEFPHINIVGFRNGFLKSEKEKETLIKNIVTQQPDFVFVAMGSPKQEYILEEIHKIYPVPMMGLGGSFNVFSGKAKRAPKWMITMKMESLYRYLFNKISFKRIKSDFKFMYMLISNKL